MDNKKVQQIKNKAYNEYVKKVTPTHNCALNMFHAFVSGWCDLYNWAGFVELL